MKGIFKNAAIFVVLSVMLSGFAACTKTTGDAPPAATGNSTASSGAPVKTADDYPPAPANIMQAEIKDVDGNTFKLEDKKGKVVLVNLWGIWCGPCVAEMPHLIEMQNEFRDKDFEIVGLNVGDDEGGEETPENIKAFAEKKKLNYQLGYADEKLFGEFVKVSRAAAVPLTVIINREGRLTGVFTGGGPRITAQMKETVEKIISQ